MTKTLSYARRTFRARLCLAAAGLCGLAIVTGCGGKSEDTVKTPPPSNSAVPDAKAAAAQPARAQGAAQEAK